MLTDDSRQLPTIDQGDVVTGRKPPRLIREDARGYDISSGSAFAGHDAAQFPHDTDTDLLGPLVLALDEVDFGCLAQGDIQPREVG